MALGATISIGLGAATLVAAPSASAGSYERDGLRFSSEDLAACAAAWSCSAWKDSGAWANTTTQWVYSSTSDWHNNEPDAYRHCIWSGALAERVGYDRAFAVVVNHEDPASDPMAEVSMDVANDRVGLDIGVRSRSEGGSDRWGWIMSQCGQRAQSGELYGLDGFLGSYDRVPSAH